MVLAAAAQRTKRIRLGTAVTLLPLHNPVKIAEEAAIADVLERRPHRVGLRPRHGALALCGIQRADGGKPRALRRFC